MPVEKLDNSFQISNAKEVRVTKMGFVTEVMYMSFMNQVARIRKIDKDTYEDLSTGEIKEFKHFENRASSKNSLRQTFRKIRNTINANITDLNKVRFITLTYRQDDGIPMTDRERLYKDFEHFNKRFKRYCTKEGYGKYEYISVVEPQGTGAWHCHVLFIFEDRAPFLKNDKIREIWGQGWVTIRALKRNGKEIDNIGAYLTAYLGDVSLEEALEQKIDITEYAVKEVQIEGKKKYFLKGARLNFYPVKFNIFRASRGIKRPEIEDISNYEAKKQVRNSTLTYQSNVKVVGDGFENVISKKYYNSNIKGKQTIVENRRVDNETGEVLEYGYNIFTAPSQKKVNNDFELLQKGFTFVEDVEIPF